MRLTGRDAIVCAEMMGTLPQWSPDGVTPAPGVSYHEAQELVRKGKGVLYFDAPIEEPSKPPDPVRELVRRLLHECAAGILTPDLAYRDALIGLIYLRDKAPAGTPDKAELAGMVRDLREAARRLAEPPEEYREPSAQWPDSQPTQ